LFLNVLDNKNSKIITENAMFLQKLGEHTDYVDWLLAGSEWN